VDRAAVSGRRCDRSISARPNALQCPKPRHMAPSHFTLHTSHSVCYARLGCKAPMWTVVDSPKPALCSSIWAATTGYGQPKKSRSPIDLFEDDRSRTLLYLIDHLSPPPFLILFTPFCLFLSYIRITLREAAVVSLIFFAFSSNAHSFTHHSRQISNSWAFASIHIKLSPSPLPCLLTPPADLVLRVTTLDRFTYSAHSSAYHDFRIGELSSA